MSDFRICRSLPAASPASRHKSDRPEPRRICHSNFTVNKYYQNNATGTNLQGGGVNKTSEFTLQMVIHPRSPNSGKTQQVLASKPGLFKLSINAHGTIDWAVSLGGKMVTATTTTKLLVSQRFP